MRLELVPSSGPGRRLLKTLIILNEPAYGNERTYNGLRLALSLAKSEAVELRVFLMGDSVTAAKPRQKTADGYYNLERMLKGLAPKEVPVGACGTCIDARGMTDEPLVEGVHRSTLAELTEWTIWADKVITF
ncbi:MAG TPA: DsrE family protein [Candidatus Limnocylindrales bacterium]